MIGLFLPKNVSLLKLDVIIETNDIYRPHPVIPSPRKWRGGVT